MSGIHKERERECVSRTNAALTMNGKEFLANLQREIRFGVKTSLLNAFMGSLVNNRSVIFELFEIIVNCTGLINDSE